MGSLASKPKAPAVRQQPVIVTVPSAVSTPVAAQPVPTSSSSAVSAPATGGEAAEQSEETLQAQARGAGLLSRKRGSLSTILTGFRGVLSDSGTASQRKTLLGE